MWWALGFPVLVLLFCLFMQRWESAVLSPRRKPVPSPVPSRARHLRVVPPLPTHFRDAA
jgi:hypothetical protein